MARDTSEHSYRHDEDDEDEGTEARREDALVFLQFLEKHEVGTLYAIQQIGDSEETGRLDPRERERFWKLLGDPEFIARGQGLDEARTRELTILANHGVSAALDGLREAGAADGTMEQARNELEREALGAVIDSSWCAHALRGEHAGMDEDIMDAYGWGARSRLFQDGNSLENVADRLVETAAEMERFLAGEQPDWFQPDLMVLRRDLEKLGFNQIHNEPVDVSNPEALREFVERRLDFHVAGRGVRPETFAMTMLEPYHDGKGWVLRNWEPHDEVRSFEPMDAMLSGRRGGFDHDRALRERVESHAAFGGDLLAGAQEGDALLAARGMTESVLALQELPGARELLREQLQQTGPRQDPQGYDLSFDHRANGRQYRTMEELTDGLRDNTLLREFIQEQLAHAGSLPDEGAAGTLARDARHHLGEALRETQETENLMPRDELWTENPDAVREAMDDLRAPRTRS